MAGRKDVLDLLDFAAAKGAGREKIGHPGTFNANPLSAAAGVATLEIIRTTDACDRANQFGATLRDQLNAVLAEERVNWAVHGSYSGFHVYLNHDGETLDPAGFDAAAHIPQMLAKGRGEGIAPKLRLGMMTNGVDVNGGPSGMISAMHGAPELETTVQAFRTALRALKRDGELPAS